MFFGSEIELDESYFGGIHKGNLSPKLLGEGGASDKTAIFGLLKRSSKVYAIVVKDTKTDTPMPSSQVKLSLIALFILTATMPLIRVL